MKTVVNVGICPRCQSECGVSNDGKYCLTHNVCGNPSGPRCDGSINTEPETYWSYNVGEDIDKVAKRIGGRFNICCGDYTNPTAFYRAVMLRIEGSEAYAAEMLYMTDLMNKVMF